MTDLTSIDFDPNANDFSILPAGHYTAEIIESELKKNSKGTGTILKLKFKISKGDYTGSVIMHTLNISHVNKDTQMIAQGKLNTLCRLCEVKYPPSTTTGLFGKLLSIKVEIREYHDSTTDQMKKTNDITSISRPIINHIETEPETGTNTEISKDFDEWEI